MVTTFTDDGSGSSASAAVFDPSAASSRPSTGASAPSAAKGRPLATTAESRHASPQDAAVPRRAVDSPTGEAAAAAFPTPSTDALEVAVAAARTQLQKLKLKLKRSTVPSRDSNAADDSGEALSSGGGAASPVGASSSGSFFGHDSVGSASGGRAPFTLPAASADHDAPPGSSSSSVVSFVLPPGSVQSLYEDEDGDALQDEAAAGGGPVAPQWRADAATRLSTIAAAQATMHRAEAIKTASVSAFASRTPGLSPLVRRHKGSAGGGFVPSPIAESALNTLVSSPRPPLLVPDSPAPGSGSLSSGSSALPRPTRDSPSPPSADSARASGDPAALRLSVRARAAPPAARPPRSMPPLLRSSAGSAAAARALAATPRVTLDMPPGPRPRPPTGAPPGGALKR